MAKINISIDDELLSRVDEVADRSYTTRSGLIAQSLTTYLTALETQYMIKDMALAIRKIADQGSVDDDTLQKIEDFERLCNYVKLQ